MKARGQPKLPPIYSYRERVDAETFALVAFCFQVRRQRYFDVEAFKSLVRPVLYGVSIFTLAPTRPWTPLETVEKRLREKIGASHGGRLPRIGPCSEVPGWGDWGD
jgi:hypothetical protein